MTSSSFNKIILLFIIVIIGVVASVIITENNKYEMQESNKRVEYTHQVFAKSSDIESSIQYNLIANRGYRISGYKVFLKETQLAHKEVNKQLEELGLLVQDNKKQLLRVKYLENLVDRRIIFLYKDNQREVGKVFDLQYNLKFLSEKKAYSDKVRKVVGVIQSEEAKLMKIRRNDYLKKSKNFYYSFYLLLGFVLLLMILMFFVLKRNLKEKVKIKDALLAKNVWYNRLMSSLGWGVISVDVNGVVSYINNVAQELSRCEEGKSLGGVVEDLFEIHNEENQAKVMKPFIDAMRTNQIIWLGSHTVMKRRDGSRIYIDGSAAPIYDDNKTIIGAVFFFRDVSENRKTQLKLLNSLKETEDYKYALDESAMVAITDSKGSITYVNDNFCAKSQYSRAELIGQDHRIIKSGYHPKEFMDEFWATISSGIIWKGEVKNRKKDGALYWVDTTIVPFLDDEGKPYQYIAIRSDITDRKKVEEEFSTLANNMSQQAWMADKDGVFWYNQRWLDYSGTTLEEVKGHGWVKVLHPDHLQRFLAKRKQGMESGEGWEDVCLLRGSDGSYRWFLSQAVPVFDDQGKVTRWFGTNTDTTILKEVEQELVEKQRQLELKIEELYKTNSELDRFVYSASHDLRAPLKSMLGLIGIVKRSEEPSNTAQIVRMEMLNDSVVRLDDFIEDILNYSRNTRMDVVNEEINFARLIEEIRNNHKFMEGANELKPLVEIDQKEKFISDKKRIIVIFNNIISNAIKYKDTSKEESFVSISVECDSEKAIITIEDNGIGIAEEKQEKVFDMFYRATKLSTGSGLGMYIVKETLEKLGGTITLESELKSGTKFSIQIPNQNN
ncbi:MAG: PAS domain S-box-containing protein [Glaciecola sp.]|jgi:PAS domain S-box-containing protein